MRTIWNAFAVICFFNVLAMLVIVGWLANSGRLNTARVQQARAIFVQTLEEEMSEQAKADEQELLDNGGIEIVIPNRPPVGAEDQLALRVLQNAADRQRIQRLEREVTDLRAALQRERSLLDNERAQLETDLADFSRMRQDIAQTEGAEQFRKALSTLESVPPKAAKDMLLAMIKSGSRDEAIGYLNAMQDRSRTKVVSELVKATETELAAELLEELRIRGVGNVPSEAQTE